MNKTKNKAYKPIASIIRDNSIIGGVQYITEDQVDDLKDADPKFAKLLKVRLNLPNESFFPSITDFHAENQVDRIYIAGEAGCGKSTFISQYVRAFLRKYPDSAVMMISSKNSDETLDCLPIERLAINEDILHNPISIEEIASKSTPCLILFDDVEDFPTKKITDEVGRLRDKIIRTGRGIGIYCCYVHHDPCDYKATKLQLFEASKVVIFPRRCGRGTYDYLLKNKLRVSDENIKLMANLRSNYVCINKSHPRALIADKYIILD